VRAAQLGADVTIIEKDNVGGTCLNWGCIPSKVMKTTAELLNNMRRASEFGISTTGPVMPDMQKLMKRKQDVIKVQIRGIEELLSHHAITMVRGKGSVIKPGIVSVKTKTGETIEVFYEKLIVATGSEPMNIDDFPFDGGQIISSNEALSLGEVPDSMVIVGGGVIGCEFACILNALGCKVTIVEALDRLLPLPSVDHECSKILQREMKKSKINFMLNQTVEKVAKGKGVLSVTIGPSNLKKELNEGDKKTVAVETDKLLVCIGRRPHTAGIGLENIGVGLDKKGWIIADKNMQTNIPGVYAIGDVLGPTKIMLAHVASAEGLIAAENAMGEAKTMSYDVVPGAIFTMPEVANVGLSEVQAFEKGLEIRSESVLFRTIGKAQVMGEIAGIAKIISLADTGRVLGVHLIGPHATDLIAEGALAVQNGLTLKQIVQTIHAHPTLPEIIMETALKSHNQGMHH
jgi:dihydrolipoamide dehydrogenase